MVNGALAQLKICLISYKENKEYTIHGFTPVFDFFISAIETVRFLIS